MLRSIVAASLLLIALDAAAQQCSGVFTSGGIFNAGFGADATAVGDFNHDGLPDLAVSDFTADSVTIFLGSTVGHFAPALGFPAGVAPDAVVVADFNEDGRADLAVVNRNSGTVSILLGNGDGTFGAPASFSTLFAPIWQVVGDFNGDHHLDLAVATFDGFSILLGNGLGGFAAPLHVVLGINITAIAAADFNGDNRLDVAVTNGNTNSVSVYLGNGNGTFGAPATFATGTLPRRVVAADLSGDSRPDLAVANEGSENVSVLLNTGGGSFAPATNYRTGNAAPDVNPVFPNSVVAGDFNTDGLPDLAVSNFGTSNVSILFGTGGGLFAPAIQIPTTYPPHAVTALNHDFVVTNINTGTIELFINACTIPALSPLMLLFVAMALAAIAWRILSS